MIISPVSSADLVVTFGDNEVEKPSFWDTLRLKIVGDFEGGDGRSTYVLPPGETYNIMLTIQNDGPGTDPTWYKAYAYQGSATNLLWQSGYVWIEYGEWYWDESWMFAYTTPTTPGTYTIYLESERGDPNTGVYGFDDIVSFNVLIEGAGTPTPTSTPYPTPTPTATPYSYPPDETPTATATATATVQPSNIPPVARITYEDMGNGKIVLRGTDSTDPDGTIAEYKWHLNDQYINGQSTFTHVFDEVGTNTIRLDVIDNDGGSSSATLIVKLQESENSAGVVIGDVDDTQAASQSAADASSGTQQPRGIWIEDGALMMPGFPAVFAMAGIVVVFWNIRRRREE